MKAQKCLVILGLIAMVTGTSSAQCSGTSCREEGTLSRLVRRLVLPVKSEARAEKVALVHTAAAATAPQEKPVKKRAAIRVATSCTESRSCSGGACQEAPRVVKRTSKSGCSTGSCAPEAKACGEAECIVVTTCAPQEKPKVVKKKAALLKNCEVTVECAPKSAKSCAEAECIVVTTCAPQEKAKVVKKKAMLLESCEVGADCCPQEKSKTAKIVGTVVECCPPKKGTKAKVVETIVECCPQEKGKQTKTVDAIIEWRPQEKSKRSKSATWTAVTRPKGSFAWVRGDKAAPKKGKKAQRYAIAIQGDGKKAPICVECCPEGGPSKQIVIEDLDIDVKQLSKMGVFTPGKKPAALRFSGPVVAAEVPSHIEIEEVVVPGKKSVTAYNFMKEQSSAAACDGHVELFIDGKRVYTNQPHRPSSVRRSAHDSHLSKKAPTIFATPVHPYALQFSGPKGTTFVKPKSSRPSKSSSKARKAERDARKRELKARAAKRKAEAKIRGPKKHRVSAKERAAKLRAEAEARRAEYEKRRELRKLQAELKSLQKHLKAIEKKLRDR